MILYLIRHAQSTNNALINQAERVCDPTLTELGFRQAQLVADHLANGVSLEFTIGASEEATSTRKGRGYGITHLYCSAMCRSLQTAQPIAKALGLSPEVWLDIHEHGGIYLEQPDEGIVGQPGYSRPQLTAEFPGYVLPEAITDEGWWTGGREEWPTCQGRALKVAEVLRERAGSNERIALVTHGGFMDSLLKALLNQLPSPQLFFSHFNTAISRLEFGRDGFVEVRYLNRIGHLPPDMVS
jgi:broad specificity phosphatase PhoE